MKSRANEFVLQFATVNGSGSQTANQVLVKTLFRMGLPVGGKNLFPSNIQGLPTWFTIRAHPEGYLSRRPVQDILVALNPATCLDDQKYLKAGGLLIYAAESRPSTNEFRSDILAVPVPFRDLAAKASESVKARKLLVNMVYVGLLAEVLGLDDRVLQTVLAETLKGKEAMLAANRLAIEAGQSWARDHRDLLKTDVRAETVAAGNQNQVLIDGNSAAALGLVFGGCTFASWYPITPSTSLMESFNRYAEHYRRDQAGRHRYAVVQAEDELAAIAMVIGAGWAGARAATATSGPGLSLMAEAAGLAYFAEIPSVIWDVQRAGPSTGLPTRTMQGDVSAAARLSHGDTKHILLFPANPAECFEFGQTALDLADRLQTLVIVMSDLDLGMNLHRVAEWPAPVRPFDRGRVLDKEDLEKLGRFARYSDLGEGVGARTLPGTGHAAAAYFARGTGHDEEARYSEDPHVYRENLDRLNRKWDSAKKLVPAPVVSSASGAEVGLIAYGSSDEAIAEVRAHLKEREIPTSYMRLKSFPFSAAVEEFISHHDRVYVIEQNRDGQMRELLSAEFPVYASHLHSVLNYDGWPLAADDVGRLILEAEGAR